MPQVATRPAPGPGPGTRWLSLGPAARMLGVDPDTLRRWGDDGRVAVFVTPGGHRRFDQRSIEQLVASRRPAPRSSLAELGATPTRLSQAYRRSYRGKGDGGIRGRFSDDDREALRASGRDLVTAIVGFLDAPDPAARAAAESSAVAAVDATALRLTAAGASTQEAAELFLQQRRPFLAELTAIACRREMDPGTMAQLYDGASTLLDRLLLRLIAALAAPPVSR